MSVCSSQEKIVELHLDSMVLHLLEYKKKALRKQKDYEDADLDSPAYRSTCYTDFDRARRSYDTIIEFLAKMIAPQILDDIFKKVNYLAV